MLSTNYTHLSETAIFNSTDLLVAEERGAFTQFYQYINLFYLPIYIHIYCERKLANSLRNLQLKIYYISHQKSNISRVFSSTFNNCKYQTRTSNFFYRNWKKINKVDCTLIGTQRLGVWQIDLSFNQLQYRKTFKNYSPIRMQNTLIIICC